MAPTKDDREVVVACSKIRKLNHFDVVANSGHWPETSDIRAGLRHAY